MNMDRRTSLYGRLSMSTTNISSPMAESTHINGSSSKFPWGGKMYSPPKSPVVNAPTALSKAVMSPINKIDHRVYIDVQSRGLASRIVRYHENGSKLNRSLSMNNIYNKPGQFPIVHLKKKEIVYKPSRNQNISMVKIAPPDKSIFHANTRSSILRTGSIVPTVGLPRSDEEISRENRPILHPVGSELAPTKSVLDALREISRKRINSDELDTSDSVKKYCKESDDTEGAHFLPTYNVVISKRQREGPSPPSSNAASPEQMSKKRMYSKNNDVLSSLSSSMRMSTPKRKFDDIRAPEKVKTPDASTSPRLKQQCIETNFVSLQKIDSVLATQITPLPPTPAAEPIKPKEIPKPVPEPVKEKLKPKLTLFNKNYDDTPTEVRTEFESNLDDFASGGIPFVKPKNNSQISDTNPIIERTKKSKLALMLSGLSGELNDEDLTDGRSPEKVEVTNISSAQPSLPVTTTVSSASISFETKTTIATATIPTVSSAKLGVSDSSPARTPILVPITSAKQEPSGVSTQSSVPLIMPSSVKTIAAGGFAFPSQISNAQTAVSSTMTTGTSSEVSVSLTFPAAKLNPGAPDTPISLKTVTTSPLAQPQFSFESKPLPSIGPLPTLPMPQIAPKVPFGVPNSIAPAVSTQLKIPATSILAPQSRGNEIKPIFGLASNNQPAFTAVSAADGMSKPNPTSAFTAAQGITSTTSIANSMFTAPMSTSLPSNMKTLFGVPSTETVKPDSKKIETRPSGGFSFTPFNPGGDSKVNNTTTPFAFSSTSSQKPAVATSGMLSFGTPVTSAPAFGVPSTSVPVSSSGATGIQFSFSPTSGKPSTGFTLAAAQNKPQTTPVSFSFGTPSKPQPAPTINTLANPVGQEQSNPFSFGAPSPQQRPVATSSIFGGSNSSEGKPFAFTSGEQKTPTASNSNIFESAPNSFPTPAPSNALNFAFVPQTTSSSIFGAPATTTSSNAFRVQPTTAPPVFGVASTSAPAFGVGVTAAPVTSLFGPVSTSSSAFGVSKATTSTVFASSASETKPVPLTFGVPASSTNAPATTKAFSFSGNNQAPSGGFSFSAAAGSTSSNGGLPVASGVEPTNSFTFRTGQSNNSQPQSVFGSSVANSTNASPMFGSPSVIQAKSFNFSAPSSAAVPPNPFGTTPAENKNDQTFNFGAPTQQPAGNTGDSKAFAFGGGSTSTQFGFNSPPASTAHAPPANKPFSFGGSSSTQPASQPNTNTAPFGFTSASNGPPAVTQANLFSPGQPNTPSTGTSRDRVIRIATRRLNK